MSDQPKKSEETCPLPEPLPEFLEPPKGDEATFEKSYFDPVRWNKEVVKGEQPDDRDPVVHDLGRLEGQGKAALFLGDFHISDGTTAGDDFLDSHLRLDEKLGVYTGFYPPGESRAGLFARVVTFARQRLTEAIGRDVPFDLVLVGDVIDCLAMLGRGGTLVSPVHKLFFRVLRALEGKGNVYWLRGNHDYVVPSGCWKAGVFYVNSGLEVLAEHGDYWDKENWPPGPTNKGSRLLIQGGGAFDVHASVSEDGVINYLMAGVDNLRPWSDRAVHGFLDRRSKLSDAAWLAALLTRLKLVGAADDSAAYKGALKRRKGDHRDWLVVQGHTHVPAAVPGVYYNTGTWITTLVAPGGEEKQVEAFPFLLVYKGSDGRRVEEFYMVRGTEPNKHPEVVLQTPESVNDFRASIGYDPCPP